MIKILVYEDNPQLREGLCMLINGSEGYEVLAAYKNCANVADEVEAWKPDVILMDIDMPGVNGIEGVKRIREKNPDVKILMLTIFEDDKNVFESLMAGANGYLLKKTPPVKLLEHISEASTGGAPMTASIAAQVLKMFAELKDPAPVNHNLSDREKEVLQQLVKGRSYKMIAAEMFIAVDTVRSHIRKIYDKLHVNSKSEAVAKAFRDNIV